MDRFRLAYTLETPWDICIVHWFRDLVKGHQLAAILVVFVLFVCVWAHISVVPGPFSFSLGTYMRYTKVHMRVRWFLYRVKGHQLAAI